MKKIIQLLFPCHIRAMLCCWGIALLLLSITRAIFYWNNKGSFPGMEAMDWVYGIWFDIITLSLWMLPLWILWLLPNPWRERRWFALLLKTLNYILLVPALALNIIDIEYYRYTAKRATREMFSFFVTGNDFNQLAGSFVKDFWLLLLLLLVLTGCIEILYRKWITNRKGSNEPLKYQIISFLICLPLIIIIGRGGLQLRPIGVIEAAKYTTSQNIGLVLNTPFTMLKSFGRAQLSLKEYFSGQEATQYFSPHKQSRPQNILPANTNVVIIILESFGVEFIGKYGFTQDSYTPFLDSLLDRSLYFQYGFANGRTSIESVPSIIASMPTLMREPYITSIYEDNKIQTLPGILKEHGYSSAFFHGATNGSMRFDAFTLQSGFDYYFGREEYNNEAHTDHQWGILDEYFNPWTAQQISSLQQPFLAALFTLSSHHPYYIPEHMRDKVKKGKQKIASSINYADYALRLFFEEAARQDWYPNTLFVLCADHTPATETGMFYLRNLIYRIPIAFYHPRGLIRPAKNAAVFQQLDIMPTVLDLLNIKTNYYAFGNSLFDIHNREAIAFSTENYFYIRNGKLMTFLDDHEASFYDLDALTDEPMLLNDSLKSEMTSDEKRLKAIIQSYNHDLKNNQTIFE